SSFGPLFFFFCHFVVPETGWLGGRDSNPDAQIQSLAQDNTNKENQRTGPGLDDGLAFVECPLNWGPPRHRWAERRRLDQGPATGPNDANDYLKDTIQAT